MGLTATPPRLRLHPPVPQAPTGVSPLVIPLAMALSLLLTASLSGPLFGKQAEVPALTAATLQAALLHPAGVRLTARLYQGPAAPHASYAFVQMNTDAVDGSRSSGLDLAACASGTEQLNWTPGTERQEALLLRLLAIPDSSWQSLSQRPGRVRPHRVLRVTLLSPGGEVLATGAISDFDRHPGVQSLLDYFERQRLQLLTQAFDAPGLTPLSQTQEPADS